MKKTLISSTLILFALTISACGSSNVSDHEVPPEIKDESGFKNVNNGDKFEIHTERQLEFLNYDGSYAKMDKSLFPDGKEHLSDSLPITLTWNYELPEANEGKEVEKYSVIYGQEKDLSDGYRVDSPADKDEITFSNPYLGENYYKLIATYTDGSTDESPIKIFRVNHTYPRNLTIDGMTNCRDIGGRATVDGGMIKQGLIYRTSGKNQNGAITDATKEEMLNHLKLKNEINLAGDSSSYNLNLEGTTLFTGSRMDTSSTGGYSHISRNTEAVKNFFNFIADENNYPLFYHCKIGTDRTGLCTILLHGLLGVSYNEIYQDYLFSNFGKIGEQRTIGDGNSHDIRKYMDDLVKYSGEKFQNKVYNILLALGVSQETLDHIINNLVDKAPTGNDADQIIATGDTLDNHGATRKERADERDNPEVYYLLENENQYVEYRFVANKAFTGQVVAYLANPDTAQSDSTNKNKKIADAITLEYDYDKVDIIDQNFYEARLGICKGNGITTRINYWPVILGTVEIDEGDHIITIDGGSYKMNIAGIYIFDNATAGGVNGFED